MAGSDDHEVWRLRLAFLHVDVAPNRPGWLALDSQASMASPLSVVAGVLVGPGGAWISRVLFEYTPLRKGTFSMSALMAMVSCQREHDSHRRMCLRLGSFHDFQQSMATKAAPHSD